MSCLAPSMLQGKIKFCVFTHGRVHTHVKGAEHFPLRGEVLGLPGWGHLLMWSMRTEPRGLCPRRRLSWSGSCGSAWCTDAQIQAEPRSPSEGLESGVQRPGAVMPGGASLRAPRAKRPRALGTSQIYYQWRAIITRGGAIIAKSFRI